MLDSYQLGELSVESNHEILEHVERCDDCRAECQARENLRAAVKRAGTLPVEPRPDLESEVRALVRRTPRESSGGFPVLLVAAALIVAAAAPFLVKRRAVPGPHP